MARIPDLLAAGLTYSFEFFPPRSDEEQARLEQTIVDLEPLRPSFVSVTYRGGASSRRRTTETVIHIDRSTGLTAMPHLTCVAHPRSELVEIIRTFRAEGMDNLLALGGDPLPDEVSRQELEYAFQLVELARAEGMPAVGVAAHPAGHPRSPDRAEDRRRLAEKLGAADFAITQFFFAAAEWEALVEDLARMGVHKPVIPGIMPITNLNSIQRMAQLAGYQVPAAVVSRLEPLADDAAAFRAAGIEIATQLCSDLLAAGAPGLHFYTLNFSRATREIHSALNLDAARG